MPPSSCSDSSNSGSGSSSSEDAWTGNEGDSTDCDVECPANPSLRGKVALVTAKCPRRYPRTLAARKGKCMHIPEDMDKVAFLAAFRRTAGSECNETLEVVTCHCVRHSRKRVSTQVRERKYHLAVRMNNNFAHKKISIAFLQKYGIKLCFNFKLAGFGAVLGHLLQEGRQSESELDTDPARYPPEFNLAEQLPPDLSPTSVETAPAEDPWTSNEGDTTDEEEEAPAHQSLRGQTALVTAACPRSYPRDLETRKAQGRMIPEDFTKEEFLSKVRKTIGKYCTVKLEKATCHDEPHKRFRPSKSRRERHKHLALKMSGNFAHKKIADAFQKEHGIRISFSFKLNRFVGNLRYLTEAGKKPTTDLDLEPATFPPTLDWKSEVKKEGHPGDAPAKAGKKRKRLSFDEVSNIIIEGIGDGPIRTTTALEEAARTLKHQGNVELWNYLGSLKNLSDIGGVLAKVWQLQGQRSHPMWRTAPTYSLNAFSFGDLRLVIEWRNGKWRSHALVLSGDGGLGKTNLAEALLKEVSPAGYWFIDDPDDFREIDGMIKPGEGVVVDEICLATFPPNQIKKLYDLEKTRRPRCRHFNASIPAGCPRIFCTTSGLQAYYPKMSQWDRTGVFRRHLFQEVLQDVRVHALPPPGTVPSLPAPASGDWAAFLEQVCQRALVARYSEPLRSAADQLGVALQSELAGVAEELAGAVGMKSLERRRFVAALRA